MPEPLVGEAGLGAVPPQDVVPGRCLLGSNRAVMTPIGSLKRMPIAPERTGIGIRRHFTTSGVHPFDQVVWERRDARITNYRDGSVAFEQRDVEFPVSWSLNATNIVAQK